MQQTQRETLTAIGAAAVLALTYTLVLHARGALYDVDRLTHFAPFAQFCLETLRQGELPLWCPDVWGGHPLHGEGHAGLFNPVKLSWLLASDGFSAIAIELSVALPVAAAAGAWAGRLLDYRPVGAALGGLVWALGGSLLAWQENPSLVTSTLIMPLAIASALRGSWRALAVCLGFSILGGHPYGYALVTAAAGVAWLARLHGTPATERRACLGRGLAALGLGLLLGAVQLLPTVEVVLDSARAGGLQSGARDLNLLGLSDLRHLFVPWPDAAVNDSLNRSFLTYVGLPALVLVGLALRRSHSDGLTRALAFSGAGLIAIALLASAFNDALDGVPLLGGLRGPSKLFFGVSVCLALLAGRGASELELQRPKLAWFALLLVALDLGAYGQRKATPIDPAALRATPRVAAAIPPGSRVRTFGAASLWPAALPASESERAPFLRDQQNLEANTGLLHGFSHLAGYSPLPNRRSLKNALVLSPIRLQRGATSHVILPLGVSPPAGLTLQERGPRWTLYRVEGALPWARLSERAVAASTWERGLDVADRLPAAVTVLVGDSAAAAEQALSGPRPDAQVAGELEVLRRSPNRIDLRVVLARPSLVVVSDAFFAGWRAEIDGAHQPLLLADGVWKATLVPAGEHRVSFTYAPLSFTLGATLSSLTALGLLLAAGVPLWRARAPLPEPESAPPAEGLH